MEAISSMVSSVIHCLNFTWDCPNRNKDLRMPVLDTYMWIGVSTRTWDLPEEILEPETSLPTKLGKVANKIVLYDFLRSKVNAHSIYSFLLNVIFECGLLLIEKLVLVNLVIRSQTSVC